MLLIRRGQIVKSRPAKWGEHMIRQIAPQFFTTNLPATLACYRDTLGFECLGTWNDPPVYATSPETSTESTSVSPIRRRQVPTSMRMNCSTPTCSSRTRMCCTPSMSPAEPSSRDPLATRPGNRASSLSRAVMAGSSRSARIRTNRISPAALRQRQPFHPLVQRNCIYRAFPPIPRGACLALTTEHDANTCSISPAGARCVPGDARSGRAGTGTPGTPVRYSDGREHPAGIRRIGVMHPH